MPITREDVEHVAFLARLDLSDEEKVRLEQQLSRILDYMRVIAQLKTDEIPPTAQVIPLRNVVRADEVQPSLDVERILANAPAREEDFFRVLPVLE